MKTDFYKKVKTCFLIVAIICMLLSILDRVSAEEMASNLQDWCTDYMDTYMHNYPDEDLQLAFSECPYFSAYSFYTRNGQYKIYVLDFYNVPYIGMTWSNDQWYNDSFSSYYGGQIRAWNTKYFDSNFSYNWFMNVLTDHPDYFTNNTALKCYRFTSSNTTNFYGSCVLSCSEVRKYYNEYNGGVAEWSLFTPNISGTVTKLHGDTNNWTSNGNPNFEYYGSYGDVYLAVDGNEARHYDDSITPPTTDPNFIIYKSFGSGGLNDPILHVGYDGQFFDMGYTYTQTTQYVLTFDVDGVTVPITVDSSTVPDDFINGGIRLPFEYVKRLINATYINYLECTDLSLIAVTVTATASPVQTGQGSEQIQTVTKSTLCNLVLKGNAGESGYSDDNYTPLTDKTIYYDQVVNGSDFYNHSGSVHNDTNFPLWAEVYTIVIHGNNYDPTDPSMVIPISYDWAVDHQTFSKFQFLGYVDPDFHLSVSNAQVNYYNDLEFHKTDIVEVIKFLGLMNSCDIVRIIVGDFDIGHTTWTTLQDNVFYMQNYYTKLSIKGIGNLQSSVEAGSYYTKGTYELLRDKLVPAVSNAVLFYETAGTFFNQSNGLLGSINTGVIDLNSAINGGFDRVVNALNGFSGGSSYDLPSLSDELQNLFIPTLTWQSIDFDGYMDSLGVLALPFEFTNDILTISKTSYSSNLEMHINDFSIAVGSDGQGNDYMFDIFEDQDYTFNPRSIFKDVDMWTMLQYLNAFALILGESWFTYCHIFRRGVQNDC